LRGSPGSRVIRLADARAQIPGPAGEHAVSLMDRGTLKVKLSCPVRPNQQTPHAQDEVYVIVRGRGVLMHDGKRDEFGPGDLLFVAAGTEHRFEDFSEDLAVWVVFFGPDGGEVPTKGPPAP
jgi:mannose-6-phosphate isomerase-like protein (cupin superfamily)